MPTMLPYTAMNVAMINSTDNPAVSVAIASSITMHRDPKYIPKAISKAFAKKLVDAGHMSLFEHVQMTFLCENISRSLLAQVTRQRSAHPTSGSQHYQNYSTYPMMIHPDLFHSGPDIKDLGIAQAFDQSIRSYKKQIAHKVSKQEARQVLPNACGVTYLWTIDARNLFNFLTERLCNRNVDEMRIFATRIKEEACAYFPELFNLAYPSCVKLGCKEKDLDMQCSLKLFRSIGHDDSKGTISVNPKNTDDYLGAPYPSIEEALAGSEHAASLDLLGPGTSVSMSKVLSDAKAYQKLLGYDISNMDITKRMSLLRDYALSLNVEVAELLQETPWKPWRLVSDQVSTSKPRVAGELTDCLVFLMNMALCLELSHEDLSEAYAQTKIKNKARALSGQNRAEV